MQQKIRPTDGNGSVWQKGLNAYNLIRTRYLFADFAHLGTAVMSGDWMLSVNGTIDGQSYNSPSADDTAKYPSASTTPAYTWFSPECPLGRRDLGVSRSGIANTVAGAAVSFPLTFSAAGRKILKVTGRTTGGTMYVAVFDRTETGSYYEIPATRVYFTSASDETMTIRMASMSAKTYYLLAWMSSADHRGTLISAVQIGFAPNFAVDLLAGKSYQNEAYARGTVIANLFYAKTVKINGGTVSIPSSSVPLANTYYINALSDITLPSASTYDGLELNFYEPMKTRTSQATKLMSPSPFRFEG